jgi:hypothetical protein
MTGPDHYRKAEELTATAHDYLGQGDGQSAAVWAAVAQIHATLVLAAATALGTTAADGRAWTEVAGTKFSARGLLDGPVVIPGARPYQPSVLARHRRHAP